MGFRWPAIVRVKPMLRQPLTDRKPAACDVPRGHFAVYVGEARKRFVVPISYLNHPMFKSLLERAEEEYGFCNPMGCLRVPGREESFVALTSQIDGL